MRATLGSIGVVLLLVIAPVRTDTRRFELDDLTRLDGPGRDVWAGLEAVKKRGFAGSKNTSTKKSGPISNSHGTQFLRS